ncbi:MAG TPA: DNA replication/repair protein RecF [Rhodobacteraceae bacterium]|jgi:DNA replication and repair protein RecF|nr:DNA replication/repair protein RecF [Paracoccaceae bacterium]HBG97661.1 DNA replication/repair protein RecF [Paracoccaceae bacterium]
MAALTALTLSHFRSHKRAELAPGAGLVVLYGPNGSGKTNVLEAVSLLSPGRGLRGAPAPEMARRPEAIGWKLTARLAGPGLSHEVETWAEPGAARQLRIDGKPAPQLALARLLRILWLTPAMDRLWSEGAEARRRFWDRITMSFTPDHAEAVLAYDKAMRERNRLLRERVRDAHWFDALEDQMARAGAALQANRLAALGRLRAALAGAETAFPAADLAPGLAEGAVAPSDAGELAAALAAGRLRDLAAGRTLTGPHRADLDAVYAAKGAPARTCSTGEQKALLISLVLANARALARDTGEPPILLLDEVAAHLDADRRAALYAEIAALGAQAWMTGTGPELFADIPDPVTRLAVEDAAGVSVVTPA